MSEAKPDVSTVEDEETLEKMLRATEDFDERKKIRAKLKEVSEKRSAEYEKKKKEAEAAKEDSAAMKQRHAEQAKQQKLAALSGPSANVAGAGPSATEAYARQKLADAEAEKQKKLETMTAMGQANQALANAGTAISSTAEKKAEAKPNREAQARAAAKAGPRGAMNAFKKMDAATTPTGTGTKPNFATGGGGGGGGLGKGRAVQRSQSDIKQMLLNWIQAQTKEYENIEIKNFSTCWSDGLAFCALIHHFYPDAFDYSKLDGKDPRANFQLAFDTAEKLADISPLIEVDDMMKMRKNPDWKCVFVYVQSFYRRFYRQTVRASEGSDEATTPTTPDTPVSPTDSTSSEQ